MLYNVLCNDYNPYIKLLYYIVDRQSTLRRSTINAEAIDTVDPGGADQRWTRRGSTVNFHFRMKSLSPLLMMPPDIPCIARVGH